MGPVRTRGRKRSQPVLERIPPRTTPAMIAGTARQRVTTDSPKPRFRADACQASDRSFQGTIHRRPESNHSCATQYLGCSRAHALQAPQSIRLPSADGKALSLAVPPGCPSPLCPAHESVKTSPSRSDAAGGDRTGACHCCALFRCSRPQGAVPRINRLQFRPHRSPEPKTNHSQLAHHQAQPRTRLRSPLPSLRGRPELSGASLAPL